MAYPVNPKDLIQLIKQGQNPQQLMLQIMESNMSNTPFGANLLYLARNNRTKEIEQIVRNLARERGIDFDKEFNAFKQRLGF